MKSHPHLKKVLAHLVVFICVFGFVGILSAEAATRPYTALAPIKTGDATLRTDLFGLFVDTFRYVIAASVALAVLMIIWGGVQIMSTDSWTGQKDGKRRIQNAVLGLILVIVCLLILETINPNITNLSILKTFGTPAPYRPAPPPPRAIPVSSGDSDTTAPQIQEYMIRHTDGKQYRVIVSKNEDAQSVNLNNLYEFDHHQSPVDKYFYSMAACESDQKANKPENIAVACHAVTNGPQRYKIAADTNPEVDFGDRAECERLAEARKSTCTAVKPGFSGSISLSVYRHTNLTKNACEYMRDRAHAQGGAVTDCTKQDKPL